MLNRKYKPWPAASSSLSSRKKPPQRGLGVAQLERIRLQEEQYLHQMERVRLQEEHYIRQKQAQHPQYPNYRPHYPNYAPHQYPQQELSGLPTDAPPNIPAPGLSSCAFQLHQSADPRNKRLLPPAPAPAPAPAQHLAITSSDIAANVCSPSSAHSEHDRLFSLSASASAADPSTATTTTSKPTAAQIDAAPQYSIGVWQWSQPSDSNSMTPGPPPTGPLITELPSIQSLGHNGREQQVSWPCIQATSQRREEMMMDLNAPLQDIKLAQFDHYQNSYTHSHHSSQGFLVHREASSTCTPCNMPSSSTLSCTWEEEKRNLLSLSHYSFIRPNCTTTSSLERDEKHFESRLNKHCKISPFKHEDFLQLGLPNQCNKSTDMDVEHHMEGQYDIHYNNTSKENKLGYALQGEHTGTCERLSYGLMELLTTCTKAPLSLGGVYNDEGSFLDLELKLWLTNV